MKHIITFMLSVLFCTLTINAQNLVLNDLGFQTKLPVQNRNKVFNFGLKIEGKYSKFNSLGFEPFYVKQLDDPFRNMKNTSDEFELPSSSEHSKINNYRAAFNFDFTIKKKFALGFHLSYISQRGAVSPYTYINIFENGNTYEAGASVNFDTDFAFDIRNTLINNSLNEIPALIQQKADSANYAYFTDLHPNAGESEIQSIRENARNSYENSSSRGLKDVGIYAKFNFIETEKIKFATLIRLFTTPSLIGENDPYDRDINTELARFKAVNFILNYSISAKSNLAFNLNFLQVKASTRTYDATLMRPVRTYTNNNYLGFSSLYSHLVKEHVALFAETGLTIDFKPNINHFINAGLQYSLRGGATYGLSYKLSTDYLKKDVNQFIEGIQNMRHAIILSFLF